MRFHISGLKRNGIENHYLNTTGNASGKKLLDIRGTAQHAAKYTSKINYSRIKPETRRCV